MSDYCRQWLADPASSQLTADTMTRLPVVQVDDHDPVTPAPRTPSPAVLHIEESEEDHDDHDDDLSINSSDLDEEGWLNVDATASVTASTTASALGSSTISDFPLSSREPSETGVSESENEDDIEDAWTGPASHVDQGPEESTYNDGETPAASQAGVFEFKSSWIFPDPTSASASLTTSAGTITDNTPLHSLANIRSIAHSTADSFREEDEVTNHGTDDPDVPEADAAPTTPTTPPADVVKRKTAHGNPFPVNPPRPERKRWSLVAMILGLFVLLIKIGPSARLDLASIMSHTFGHSNATTVALPAPLPSSGNWALGSTDLQIVKDALAALATTTDPVPNNKPTEAPTTPSEYSYVWNRIRRGGKTSTDIVATTVTNSLSVVPQIGRRWCQCPPQQCKCPPPVSIYDQLLDGLIALDAYARWMSDMVAALAYHGAHWLRSEAELEFRYRRALLDDFVKSPTVRVVVERAATQAANSRQALRRVYAHARDRVCANGRCDRATETARDAAREAQARGWRSVLQARRGLDVAITHGQRVVNEAVAASNELLDGAVAGARGFAEKTAAKTSGEKVPKKVKEERKRCGGGKWRRGKDAKSASKPKSKHNHGRRRWGKGGKKDDPNQRLQCGFRGYARGCATVDEASAAKPAEAKPRLQE